MFIGHFAVGFAAKRAAPKTSLAVLLTAASFLDVLWPLLLWTGLERVRIDPGNTPFTPLDFESYPWSHSLLMAAVWSVVIAVLYRARTRYATGALVVGLAVFSHWVLDFVTHRPDLPLWPGGPRVGLGLWYSVPATLAVEIPMFIIGVAIYARTTRAKNVWGHVSLWLLVALIALAYYGNVTGPPPPTFEALRVVATATLLFVLWYVWIDRTRELRTS